MLVIWNRVLPLLIFAFIFHATCEAARKYTKITAYICELSWADSSSSWVSWTTASIRDADQFTNPNTCTHSCAWSPQARADKVNEVAPLGGRWQRAFLSQHARWPIHIWWLVKCARSVYLLQAVSLPAADTPLKAPNAKCQNVLWPKARMIRAEPYDVCAFVMFRSCPMATSALRLSLLFPLPIPLPL